MPTIRVSLFDMSGVYLGVKTVDRTAKNYCDGSSTIKLAPVLKHLVLWDECQEVIELSEGEFKQLSFD